MPCNLSPRNGNILLCPLMFFKVMLLKVSLKSVENEIYRENKWSSLRIAFGGRKQREGIKTTPPSLNTLQFSVAWMKENRSASQSSTDPTGKAASSSLAECGSRAVATIFLEHVGRGGQGEVGAPETAGLPLGKYKAASPACCSPSSCPQSQLCRYI